MEHIKTQAVVCGGGSGGFAAAYTLAKGGINVILIEKNKGIGGTSVFAGVNCWEPGVASGKVHRELFSALSKIPDAAAVSKTVPNSRLFIPDSDITDFSRYPWGLSVKDAHADYSDTLKRCISLTGGKSENYRRFQFEPKTMADTMMSLLKKYNTHIFCETEFISSVQSQDRITDIIVSQREREIKISADYFIDATGDIALARDAGCDVTIGTEAKEEYGEPSASKNDPTDINGVSYVFRVTKTDNPSYKDNLPESEPYPQNTVSCFNLYPNGDINVNMLPTVKGSDYIKLKDSADEVCRSLVYSYWNRLQNDYGMSGYKFMYLFPMPGIRESYRLKGRYVLTENDLLAGFEHQARRDEIIALADHARDTHGSGGCNELENPYGIPFSCMLPKEYDNLYVCCRGASFSHIAASSARLSRTMLSLGEAAAHAVIMQINDGKIDFPTLKNMQNIPF